MKLLKPYSTKKKLQHFFTATSLSLITAVVAPSASADSFSVTVTNVTRGQFFTPRLVTTHSAGNFFTVGQPAVAEIAAIAESGDVAPTMALLDTAPEFVTDVEVGGGLLAPGESQEVMIEGNAGDVLTVISMLIPTNDAFFAANAVSLPTSGSVTVNALVYDAGTEPNDELCANIPGPVCGGEGSSLDVDGEGFVHVHAGIHGIGDLAAENYDWRNPGARITITKLP